MKSFPKLMPLLSETAKEVCDENTALLGAVDRFALGKLILIFIDKCGYGVNFDMARLALIAELKRRDINFRTE